jgi:predicted Zn-dependent peptidase
LTDKGLVESAAADFEEKFDTGIFLGYANAEPSKIDMVAERLRAILESPMEFSEEDLERVKTKLVTRIVLSGELPIGRLMSLGSEWLCRKEVHSLRSQIERVRAVTKDDIRAAVDAYGFKEWSEYRLIPGEECS